MKSPSQLDMIDRRLLQITQDEFPLTPRPWAKLSNKLGITEEEVLKRVTRLHTRRIVRKIGPALDPKRVGLRASTLIAMKLPKNRIQRVGQLVSKHEEVSHCYQREHEYNLWFTLAAHDETELKTILDKIKKETRIRNSDMLNLPTTKMFKIDVRFKFNQSM